MLNQPNSDLQLCQYRPSGSLDKPIQRYRKSVLSPESLQKIEQRCQPRPFIPAFYFPILIFRKATLFFFVLLFIKTFDLTKISQHKIVLIENLPNSKWNEKEM